LFVVRSFVVRLFVVRSSFDRRSFVRRSFVRRLFDHPPAMAGCYSFVRFSGSGGGWPYNPLNPATAFAVAAA